MVAVSLAIQVGCSKSELPDDTADAALNGDELTNKRQRAMRCENVKSALVGGADLSQDMQAALVRVCTPTADDIKHEAAQRLRNEPGTERVLVVYISPKKALEGQDAPKWLEAIDA